MKKTVAETNGQDLSRCIGAISVTNLAARMTAAHRGEVLRVLQDELARIDDRLRMVPTFT